MNAKPYLTEISHIPAKHQPLFIALNEKIELAFKKAEKGILQLTQSPIIGDYFFVNEAGELVEISKWQDEDTGERGYTWKEANNRWYSDPVKTLREVKQNLGIK